VTRLWLCWRLLAIERISEAVHFLVLPVVSLFRPCTPISSFSPSFARGSLSGIISSSISAITFTGSILCVGDIFGFNSCCNTGTTTVERKFRPPGCRLRDDLRWSPSDLFMSSSVTLKEELKCQSHPIVPDRPHLNLRMLVSSRPRLKIARPHQSRRLLLLIALPWHRRMGQRNNRSCCFPKLEIKEPF
jgi:hypothetical protein